MRSKGRNSAKVWTVFMPRLGATPSGVTRKCCASRNAQSDGCRGGLAASAGGGPDQGARGAGPRDTLHGTPSRPNHPPQAPTLDVARSSRRDERQGQHSTRRAQMLLARHHRRACASTCRPGDLAPGPRSFPSAPPASCSVCDFAINCSTTGSFERRREPRGHHFRDSRCASRSRERTVACFFTSRLRISPIPYPLRNQDVHADCTLCRLLAWSCASRCVDVAACRLLSAAGRKTDAHLGNGAFRNMLQLAASPDDSQHPIARSRVDFRSRLAL